MGLLGTVGSQAAELAPQVEQIGGEVSMLAQYLPVLGYVATGQAIAGVCLALYARWDDMRTKGV